MGNEILLHLVNGLRGDDDLVANGAVVEPGGPAVVDQTPPILANLPGDLTVPAEGPSGAAVVYTLPTATDAVDPEPTVTCAPPSGSIFPVGTTVVAGTATDNAGNSSTASFTVTVQGTGNVSARVVRKRLIVTGDDENNIVRIEAGDAGPNSLRVTGLGTRMNGRTDSTNVFDSKASRTSFRDIWPSPPHQAVNHREVSSGPRDVYSSASKLVTPREHRVTAAPRGVALRHLQWPRSRRAPP